MLRQRGATGGGLWPSAERLQVRKQPLVSMHFEGSANGIASRLATGCAGKSLIKDNAKVLGLSQERVALTEKGITVIPSGLKAEGDMAWFERSLCR